MTSPLIWVWMWVKMTQKIHFEENIFLNCTMTKILICKIKRKLANDWPGVEFGACSLCCSDLIEATFYCDSSCLVIVFVFETNSKTSKGWSYAVPVGLASSGLVLWSVLVSNMSSKWKDTTCSFSLFFNMTHRKVRWTLLYFQDIIRQCLSKMQITVTNSDFLLKLLILVMVKTNQNKLMLTASRNRMKTVDFPVDPYPNISSVWGWADTHEVDWYECIWK